MAVVWWYALVLFAIWSGPSLLVLSRYTYDITPAAHFVSFLGSVMLFALMGRVLRRREKPRWRTGFGVGAGVAVAGTAASQVILHLPPARRVFIAQIPQVPPQAATLMLGLHALTSAILSAAMFAVLYGTLGAIATWWGGRTLGTGSANPREDPST